MLKRIVDAACAELACIDQDNLSVAIKFDNTAYTGVRKLYTDQMANTVSKEIKAGSVLTVAASGEKFIVGTLTIDYYKDKVIRHVLDLLETNNTVSVLRPTHTPSPQGGMGTVVKTPIYENIPVKIWNISLKTDKANDSTAEQMGMLLSTLYPVQHGDILTFGSYYDTAKVEGIKHNFEGFFEIVFDKDPRWM